jgi:hypothetical protein
MAQALAGFSDGRMTNHPVEGIPERSAKVKSELLPNRNSKAWEIAWILTCLRLFY